MINRLWQLAGLGAAASLLFAVSGFAQAPTDRVYGGQGGDIQGELGGAAGGGALPFTGVDLLLMAAAAMLLIASGLTIRRLARAKSPVA